MWIRLAGRYFGNALLVLFLAGLACATMVRFAPGFGTDERVLDLRLREDSIEALRQDHQKDSNILRYYSSYLMGMLRGDLGVSKSLNQPVKDLIAARIPISAANMGIGLALGWSVAMLMAVVATMSRLPLLKLTFTILSGAVLCVPAAILALFFLMLGWSAAPALGLVLFPRVFRFARNLLEESWNQPHVLTARAKGVSMLRIILWHVTPVSGPQLVALGAATVSMAFGALIPIEVLCDSPGIGQLAWQAALGRDLPLLVSLTALATLMTVTAGAVADLAVALRPAEQAAERGQA